MFSKRDAPVVERNTTPTNPRMFAAAPGAFIPATSISMTPSPKSVAGMSAAAGPSTVPGGQ
jgi:hypothetical protein